MLSPTQLSNESFFIIKASMKIVMLSSYLDLIVTLAVYIRVHDLLKSAGCHVHCDSLLASCFDKELSVC